MSTDTPGDNGAIFSDCRTWRYLLWRNWDLSLPACAFIGLNPSTADETQDDPTIRRCIQFAKGWGFGSLWMLNLFAFRATKPADMKKARDPVGPDNNAHLSARLVSPSCGRVIAAWGKDGGYRARDWKVRRMAFALRGAEGLECLGRNKDGTPEHPLYIPKDRQPIVFSTGEQS